MRISTKTMYIWGMFCRYLVVNQNIEQSVMTCWPDDGPRRSQTIKTYYKSVKKFVEIHLTAVEVFSVEIKLTNSGIPTAVLLKTFKI